MNVLHRHGVEAWPIGYEAQNSLPMLRKIVIASKRPHDKAKVHLTPEQALYAQARMSVIKSAIQGGHLASIRHLGSARLPDDHADHLKSCGAKVWTISEQADATHELVTQVVIESSHPDGYGMVSLSPVEALHIADRLTQITLAFLHDSAWGGEDARNQ
jgi:hypothetical protein